MVSKYITGVHSCLTFALGRDIPRFRSKRGREL